MRFLLSLSGRGALPFAPLHGASLFRHALAALPVRPGVDSVLIGVDQGEAQRRALPELSAYAEVVDACDVARTCAGDTLVVHDPLCPLTPQAFISAMLTRFDEDGEYAAAAHRPVTDTIKRVRDGCVTDTIDREGLGIVTAPVILSAQAVADLGAGLATDDLAELVTSLRAHGPVSLVKAPSMGRRVDNDSAVRLLECVEEMSRELRA